VGHGPTLCDLLYDVNDYLTAGHFRGHLGAMTDNKQSQPIGLTPVLDEISEVLFGKVIDQLPDWSSELLEDDPPPPVELKLPEWNPSPDQEVAWEKITSWIEDNSPDKQMLFSFGGLGGTGKTFLTSRLAVWLLNKGIEAVYAAPTGKAVLVLKNNLAKMGLTGELVTVRTVHGTIYKPVEDKNTGRILGWEERGDADYDIILVDEFSMVAAPELAALRRLGKPILAIGDHGQLSPVGEDTGVMLNPDVKLEKIHRLAHGNPIIRLAHMVRRGAPDDVIRDFIDDMDDPRLSWSRQIGDAIEKGKPPGVVLTFTNRMRRNINIQYREDVLSLDEYDGPAQGEMIICLKNKRLNDSGFMVPNGMRGVIVSQPRVTEHHVYADVQFDEPVGLLTDFCMCKHQFLREKTFAGFDEVPGKPYGWGGVGALCDFSYAITGHKSQGSGFPSVVVVVERALGVLSDEERKRWLYTAYSRSSDSLHVIFA